MLKYKTVAVIPTRLNNIFLICALSFTLVCHSQTSLGVLFGDNGQVRSIHHRFYFPFNETGELDDSNTGKETFFSLGLEGRTQLKKIFLNYNAEYGLISQHTIRHTPTEDIQVDLSQHTWYLSFSFGYQKTFDHLSLGCGVGLPFYVFSAMKGNGDYSLYTDSTKSTKSYQAKWVEKMDGGFSIGLSQLVFVSYSFNDRFALQAETQFGMLYSVLGKEFKYTTTYEDPASTSPLNYVYEKKYQQFSFPAPTLKFGFVIKLNKTP